MVGPVEQPTRSSPGFTAVVKCQWRFAGHPSVFYLGYGRNGNVECYKWHVGLVDGETDVYRLPEAQSRPAVGRWVHIAGVYDAASGKASLYVDGKLLGDDTQAGEMRLDPESLSRPLMIGGELIDADVNDVQNVFDGYVDDVRVYDRALSAEEIGKLAAEAEDKRVAR
jgi:fructan beta-fructosidase